ncbi:hypothetical protein GDO81_009930 [Engystomops pustulosus]|uniref:Uncharacterized protein n=1 Tax=Engystomops pustulosus TaxID=76066 RepID=A0AAV7BVQ1_ENGPU|nr:hypothetical protein GDO81_009930 [Engystomops pustulosus]
MVSMVLNLPDTTDFQWQWKLNTPLLEDAVIMDEIRESFWTHFARTSEEGIDPCIVWEGHKHKIQKYTHGYRSIRSIPTAYKHPKYTHKVQPVALV